MLQPLTNNKNMKKKIVIIGGEGTSTNIAESILDAQKNHNVDIEFLGFINDNYQKKECLNGFPILCSLQKLSEYISKNPEIGVIFSMYKPLLMRERAKLLNSLFIPISCFVNFVHPLSYLSSSAILGYGNIILSNSSIHNNVSIGNFNIINSNCVVEHDTTINNSVFFAAGTTIGSGVNLSDSCFIGLNSCIKEGLEIPMGSFIGMGSVMVTEPKTEDEIWYGNPAKRIRKNDY